MPARTNYIQHLNAFFAQVRKDERLHANHISLYLALFQVWNQYRFHNPFPILREEVLQLCHIGSLNTYTRCLKELHHLGYILYQPAPQRGAPSLISMEPLGSHPLKEAPAQLALFEEPFFENNTSFSLFSHSIPGEPLPAHPCRKIATANRKNDTATSRKNDTGAIAKLRRFNKHINNYKTERENTPAPIKKIKKNEVKNHHSKPVIPPPAAAAAAPLPPPALPDVQQFFQGAGYPDQEARKFFHHYQANGWLQGGAAPITNWPAAAHKWMLNVKPSKIENHDTTQRTTAQPGRLYTNENKSYSDPL